MTSCSKSDVWRAVTLGTSNQATCIICSQALIDEVMQPLYRFVNGIIEASGISDSERENLQRAFLDPRWPSTLALSGPGSGLTLNFLPKRIG